MEWIRPQEILPQLGSGSTHVLSEPPEVISHLLRSKDFDVYTIDGDMVTDEASFFEQVAQALRFPSYFGRSWNAFNDCLGDLEDRPATRQAIVWNHVDRLVVHDLQTFVNAVTRFDSYARTFALRPRDPARTVQLEIFLLLANR